MLLPTRRHWLDYTDISTTTQTNGTVLIRNTWLKNSCPNMKGKYLAQHSQAINIDAIYAVNINAQIATRS
jgi:hypothetical protein